ncbi:MAG: VCBS repeat-containing protein [Theionarchaea archaeon]|nr:VCBS repeat-containing protein [Theionarchaea archaeon]
MNFRKMTVGIGCILMMLTVLVSQSIGMGPTSWSYRIVLLSDATLSDDGERFLIGSENGAYFVLDRFGNMILNGDFERAIHAVDIAENGNMIFGMEDSAVLLDEQGKILSSVYPTEPVLYVSMAKNGLYAVAGTQKKIFLMSIQELIWESEMIPEDSLEIFISEVAISASGSAVAAAEEKSVFLFGSASSTYKAKIDFDSAVTSLIFLPSGNDIVIGTREGILSIHDIEGNRKFSYSLEGSINSIAVNPEQILVGTSKGEVALFEQNENILLKKVTEGSVDVCDISDDGMYMVILDSEENVSFFNILTEKGWKFTLRDSFSIKMSKNGKYVGITGRNGIYFVNNWENTFEGTRYFPYVSYGTFSLENDLRRIWSYPSKGITCFDYGDINGDGWNEVVFRSGAELVVLNHQGKLLWKESFSADVEVVHIQDVTEDAVPEIIIGLDDGRLNMEVWSGEGEKLAAFDFMGIFGVTPHPGAMGMEPITAMDIDHDGVVEIISRVRIEYPGTPGGIFAFEYPSGTEEWFYPIAPLQVGCALTDINNDGNLELVLGSHSLCRGTAVGGRDDCHVYVMVVDLEGNEIWAKEIASGSRLLQVAVSDLDGDGRKEIIGTVESEDDTYGKLFILDNRGNYIREEEFDYSVLFGGIADFDKDGYQEIVVTDSKGRVVMYDYKLTFIRDFDFGEGVTPYVEGIADLDGDKDKTLEIVTVADSRKLIILGSDLAELIDMWIYEGSRVTVANISGCAIDLLVHSSDRIELYSLRNERTYFCFLVEEKIIRTWSLDEEILQEANEHFLAAETYYKNLEFDKAEENYEKAKELYEKVGSVGKILECIRMLERIEDLREAQGEINKGKDNLAEGDYKYAQYDFFEAKVLFDELLERETFPEVKEWFQTQIDECESYLEASDELGEALRHLRDGEEEFMKALENHKNGEEKREMQNLRRAREYFESALPAFEEHNVTQFSQQAHKYLEEIEKRLGEIERKERIKRYFSTIFSFFLVILSIFWFIRHRPITLIKVFTLCAALILATLILVYLPNLLGDLSVFIQEHSKIIGIILLVITASIFWRYLQNRLYRNKNYSTWDSLLYTFHIKKFSTFSLIANPYYTGTPVRDESMFFGRENVLESLKHELITSNQNSTIILYGESKTGKTSILFQIENGKLNPGPEFIPVYVNMNSMIVYNDYEFLSTLASLIQETIRSYQIQMPTVPFEKTENPYLHFRDNFLRNVIDFIGGKRILFLVDEYEVIERKIIERKLSKDIFIFLKSVVEHESKFSFIFAGSRKIEQLENSDEWARALGASVYKRISFLKKEDAVKLIRHPVAEKVWYTNRAVKELLELSGCHPYILQYFCFNLVSLLNETSNYTVDIREIEKTAQDIIENPPLPMILLWNNFTLDQKKLVSLLAESIQKKGGSIHQKRIFAELEKRNIELFRDRLVVLDGLVDKDILRRERYKYSFCIEIFRRFVAEHHPLLRVL